MVGPTKGSPVIHGCLRACATLKRACGSTLGRREGERERGSEGGREGGSEPDVW